MSRVLNDGLNVGTPAPRRGASAPDTAARVRSMTVAAVLEEVKAGTLDRADALAAERAGKARTSLLQALEG